MEGGRAPVAGMGVARMVGHITYLSAQALEQKFEEDQRPLSKASLEEMEDVWRTVKKTEDERRRMATGAYTRPS